MFGKARNNPIQREIWADFAQAENDKNEYFDSLIEKSEFLQNMKRQENENIAKNNAESKATIEYKRQEFPKKQRLHVSR